MNKMHYPACGDFYSKNFTSDEYKQQIETIKSIDKNWVAVGEKGFRVITLIEKIFQVVKGFFGFTNESHITLINSEILKLLHYGETKGYNDSHLIYDLAIPLFSARMDLEKTFKGVLSLLKDKNNHPDYLKIMRKDIMGYHQIHQKELTPFWFALFNAPTIEIKEDMDYGDTYLSLASEAFDSENFEAADGYLKRAKEINNSSISFQHKLATEYLNFFRGGTKIQKINAQVEILQILESLQKAAQPYGHIKPYFDFLFTHVTIETDDYVKKCLLIHEAYGKTEALSAKISTWKLRYDFNPQFALLIADAAYEGANNDAVDPILLYKNVDLKIRSGESGLDPTRTARMFYRLAKYYTTPGTLTSLIGLDYDLAIDYLNRSLKIEPSSETYQNALFDICIKAANAEAVKTRLTYKIDYHIKYLMTAYKLLPNQFGDYLKILIQLLLKVQPEEALKIFHANQNNFSTNKVFLESKEYYLLSKQLYANGDILNASLLLEQSFNVDNKVFKKADILDFYIKVIKRKIEIAKEKSPEQKKLLLEKIINTLVPKIGYIPDKSLVEVKKILKEISKEVGDIYQKKAEEYHEQKNHAEALNTYKIIIEKFQNITDKEYLAMIYFEAGHQCQILKNTKEIDDFYRLACELNPKNPYYLAYSASYVSKKLSDQYLSKAIKCFKDADAYRRWYSSDYNLWKMDFDNWIEGNTTKPTTNPHAFS